MDIKEELYLAIKNYTKSEIDDNKLLKEDLGIDSIKGFKLLMELEKKNITLKDGYLKQILTVNDLISCLEEK
jgi:acyl carrier protein